MIKRFRLGLAPDARVIATGELGEMMVAHIPATELVGHRFALQGLLRFIHDLQRRSFRFAKV